MSCDVGEQSSFSNPCHFTYVTSFSNPSVALPTSQFILQPFRCFTYVTIHSPTFLSLLLRYRLFTFVTLRAAHEFYNRILSYFYILTSIRNRGSTAIFHITTKSSSSGSYYLLISNGKYKIPNFTNSI